MPRILSGAMSSLGKKAVLAYGAGQLFGPAGVGAALFGKAGMKGAQKGFRGARGAATRASGYTTSALQKAPDAVKASRVAQFGARRPIASGALAVATGGSIAAGYGNLPGANVSRRNQNDWYLKRVRRHQQSSALTGLAPMARSIGGMTG